MFIFVTDANLDYHNSTRKLLIDIKSYTDEINLNIKYICCRSFKKKNKGYEDIRTPFYKSSNNMLRVVSELYFTINAIYLIFKSRHHVKKIAVISPSIFSCFLITFCRKFTKSYIYLIQRDLFPFNLNETGKIPINSIKYLILKKFFTLQLKYSHKVGFENSRDLETITNSYPKLENKFEVCKNWIIKNKIYQKFNKNFNKKIIYCGNLGHMQDTKKLLNLINKLEQIKLYKLDIYGFGKEEEIIRKACNKSSYSNFFGHINQTDLEEKLCNYSYGIVTLQNSVTTNNLPGKMFLYLQFNLRLLVSASENSELYSIVKKYNLGTAQSATKNNSIYSALKIETNKEIESKDVSFNNFLKLYSVEKVLKTIYGINKYDKLHSNINKKR